MWTCTQCGERLEDQFDSCWKCASGGTVLTPLDVADVGALASSPRSGPPWTDGIGNIGMIDMPMSTTPYVPGRAIGESRGIACGEAIIGTSIFRDIFAGITDLGGGRSGAYEGKLREARTIALREMAAHAKSLGADAVVGVDLDYETIAQSMLMVSASGTAVTLKR